MRIGLITSVGATLNAFFPPIIEHWESMGHQVFTAASDSFRFERHTILNAVTRNPSPKNLGAPFQLSKWAKMNNLDVIITNTATVSFLSRVVKMPVPVIYFCHGLHWNSGNEKASAVWKGLEYLSLRNTAAVITINHDDEAWFKEKAPGVPALRIASGVGVPIDKFPRAERLPVDGAVKLVWAGEFSKRKRPLLAIDVVRQMVEMGAPVHLTMCGRGEFFEDAKKMIRDQKLENQISLEGYTKEVHRFLSESHVLLMTSEWEGLPRIGLEALAIDRPIYAFDVKGTRSLPLVNTVAEYDVEGLAKLIIRDASMQFADNLTVNPEDLTPDSVAEEILRIVSVGVEETRK